MSTETQKNLQERNAQYVAGFNQGHLALPPAKKYLVCMYDRGAELVLGDTSSLTGFRLE